MDIMWKIIPDTNRLYLANKNGDIIRAAETVAFGKNTRTLGQRPLSQKTKQNGYKEVNLHLERNKGTSKYVHRLIARTFIGEIPKGYNVNHKDGDKSNNRLENLEILTCSQNTKHAINNGLFKPKGSKGSKHHRSTTNEKEVKEIRSKHQELRSISKLSKLYPHITISTLGKIVYKQTWRHI